MLEVEGHASGASTGLFSFVLAARGLQSRWTRHASHSANRFAGPLWAWRLGQRRACAAAAVGSGVRCQSTAPAQRPPKVLLKSVRRFLQKVIPKFLPGSAEPRVTNPSFGLSRPAPFRLSPGGPYAEGGRGIRRTFLLTPRRGHRGIAHLIRAPFRGLRVCWRTSDKSVVVWPFCGRVFSQGLVGHTSALRAPGACVR